MCNENESEISYPYPYEHLGHLAKVNCPVCGAAGVLDLNADQLDFIRYNDANHDWECWYCWLK